LKIDPFEYALLKFVKEKELISKGDRVLLAVSGGADSVAMLYAFAHLKKQLEADFIVAHLNHKIRSEAELEGIGVKKMADSLGIECTIGSIDVPYYRKKHKGLSMEEAARIVRYEFFEEMAGKYGTNKIATAHHLSDLTENFFLRLFRGSGIGGLVGMSPMNGKYIKPFLIFEEKVIRKYVKINGLEFFEDRTNFDTEYLRNRIRHKLIPEIKSEFCSNLEQLVLQTSEILKQYQDHVNSEVEKVFIDASRKESLISFDLERLRSEEKLILSELFKMVLKEIDVPISNQKINSIVGLLYKDGDHELDVGKGFKVIKERKTFSFGVKRFAEWEGDVELSVPEEVKIEELSLVIRSRLVSKISAFGDNRTFVTLDADKMKFPLSVRKLSDFEKIVPFGMKEEVRVKDILKNHHVPFDLRKNFPVLSQPDGKIVWVVGITVSEEFRIRDETKNILILEKEGGNF
jgi:tRNA(Ile)-lysidine synthase